MAFKNATEAAVKQDNELGHIKTNAVLYQLKKRIKENGMDQNCTFSGAYLGVAPIGSKYCQLKKYCQNCCPSLMNQEANIYKLLRTVVKFGDNLVKKD